MDKTRVLVVDDEEDFQNILRQVLEPAGFSVSCAGDGVRGLEAMRREKPDLMILDVNMPELDGYAVCREARADPEFLDLPILMLTIRRQDAEITKGLELGADDYLSKPFKPDELLARVRSLLRRA